MTDRIFRFARELQGVVDGFSSYGWEWSNNQALDFKVVHWELLTALQKSLITTACTGLNFIFDRDE